MLIALFPSRYPANIAEEVVSRTIKERVGGDPEAINAISPTGALGITDYCRENLGRCC